jgi:membrane fusion protein (multidrug efflux system)
MNARVDQPAPGQVQPAGTTVAQATAAPKKRNGRRLALMLSVPAVLAAGGAYFYLTGGRYIETDNAYVQQSKVSISSDVAGRIVAVNVTDNQSVTAGEELFAIDAEPYRIALAQADAALATARVNVEQLRVAYGTAKAKLASAKASLDIRQAEYDRKASLVKQGVSAESALDDLKLALQSAQATLSLAEQEVASSTAALAGDPAIATDTHPAVRAALAARDAAQRNLDKTRVLAPADGIVSQVGSLNVGQFIATGSTIATLVETGKTWVEANFKETQLGALSTGMPAEVSIDAFPGVKLAGHVESIGAGTGAEFALIPAQNATGNWVKVTQRIPVVIRIDEASGQLLRAGMSSIINVDTKAPASGGEAK